MDRRTWGRKKKKMEKRPKFQKMLGFLRQPTSRCIIKKLWIGENE